MLKIITEQELKSVKNAANNVAFFRPIKLSYLQQEYRYMN